MTAKLLVVDDEPRTAELTAEILRRAGYSVDVAGSGTEALERVRLGSPDLMLLDYEMPDMEAPEVLDSLRSGARVDANDGTACQPERRPIVGPSHPGDVGSLVPDFGPDRARLAGTVSGEGSR